MNPSKLRIPFTKCAFHQFNKITHFCPQPQCLLPLCPLCIPLHNKQHPLTQLIPIQNKTIQTYSIITQQLSKLQHIYIQIIQKLKHSNHLHSQLRSNILKQKDKYILAFNAYFQSLCKEMDYNYQRKQKWLKDISQLYIEIRQEMLDLQANLQTDKYLRTIIMWNKLRPQESIQNIMKKIQKQFQPPSSTFCDVQNIISYVDKSQKLTILDLQGDLGLSSLSKLIYKLRYGQDNKESINSNSEISIKNGISIISKNSNSGYKRLKFSKSTDRI